MTKKAKTFTLDEVTKALKGSKDVAEAAGKLGLGSLVDTKVAQEAIDWCLSEIHDYDVYVYEWSEFLTEELTLHIGHKCIVRFEDLSPCVTVKWDEAKLRRVLMDIVQERTEVRNG